MKNSNINKPARITLAGLFVYEQRNIFLCQKFNTGGVIAGLLVGTIASIGLVMVSPNMTYPKTVANGAKKVVVAMEKKQAALPPGATLSEKDAKALDKAQKDVLGKDGKSIMGLTSRS